jgi:hypothetical protein
MFQAAFSDDKFRCHQVEFATSIPEEKSALLMTSFDHVLAGTSGKVADHGGFNVDFASSHNLSLGSETVVCPLLSSQVG